MTGDASLDEMDKDLAILFKQGSEKDYHKLYNRYAPAVLGVLTRMLKDPVLAENCVQDSFCEIWRRRNEYDPSKERLFTWMIKIVRNRATCIAIIANDAMDEFRESIDLVYATDIKEFLLNRQKADAGNFAENIDEQIKEAIDLIYFKGFSFASAASQLNIPVDTLRGKMVMTIKQLKGSVLG